MFKKKRSSCTPEASARRNGKRKFIPYFEFVSLESEDHRRKKITEKKKENKKISLRKKGELKDVSNQSITYIATTPVRTAPIKDYNAIVINIELNSPLC